MPVVDGLLISIVFLALVFDFVNGFHDTANAIATTVMTNALKIPYAIGMAAILNFFGAVVGTHVAETIGNSIVDPTIITKLTILVTLISSILWNLVTWQYGLPSSSSHALIGSLLGVALVQGVPIKFYGLKTIVLALVISPVLGLVGGTLIMILFYHLFRNIEIKKLDGMFRKIQIFSAGCMAFSHGGNDAQKSMGIITMALLANKMITGFAVPKWVMIACALSMALGTAVGGWRIIKTVGRGIIELKPIQGCVAETTSALVIQFATHFGMPVSTTHVVTSAICGVGTAENIYNVNWNVMKNIVTCWLITIPLVAAFSGLLYKLISMFV
ncbi:MAG: inorganic phosphate transporter [Candidatus Riflebacteria bacterium]|nr:inorganic phosphate transporter [Candidatus Riflebacteria bacterium]